MWATWQHGYRMKLERLTCIWAPILSWPECPWSFQSLEVLLQYRPRWRWSQPWRPLHHLLKERETETLSLCITDKYGFFLSFSKNQNPTILNPNDICSLGDGLEPTFFGALCLHVFSTIWKSSQGWSSCRYLCSHTAVYVREWDRHYFLSRGLSL